MTRYDARRCQTYLVVLLVITCCGCASRQPDDWLTAADWARAHGGMWFKMKIEGSTGKNNLDLRLVTKDGDPSSSGGIAGLKNGTIVKVILWEEDGKMHCALIDDSTQDWGGGSTDVVLTQHRSVFRSSVALPKDTDNIAHVKPNGSLIKVGDIFYKCSAGSIGISQELQEGEYGLKFEWR